MRIAAIFVAVCMVLIAGSAGAVVYLYFGLSLSEAIAVAIAILAALALYNTISTRVGLRRAYPRSGGLLRRGSRDRRRRPRPRVEARASQNAKPAIRGCLGGAKRGVSASAPVRTAS